MAPNVLRLLAGCDDATASALAAGALGGDGVAAYALSDYLDEKGLVIMRSLKVGDAYLFKTLTHYYTGRVVSRDLCEVVLQEAAWIPDLGREHVTLRTGRPEEVEPVGSIILNLACVVSVQPWPHALPVAARPEPR